MSGESEIKLMLLVTLFSPIVMLGIVAACNAVFQRMNDIELHWTHHHPRVTWSMHRS